MRSDKKAYSTPGLTAYGRIEDITGQTCAGGGINLGWSREKNIGYPSDQVWKIVPLCSAPTLS